MNTHPLISVILPVFNTEKYVAEAIESVLNQSYTNIELICINDGSTDRSIEILKSYGSKIILIDSKENCGIGETRNKGIRIAKGDYIAFMDADDIWNEKKLETQLKAFEQNPTLAISFSHMGCFISPELPEEIKKLRYCPPGTQPGYISATAMIKASSFHKVGLFKPEWRVGEFVDWYARAKEIGLQAAIVPDVFLRRRIHDTNTGVRARDARVDYIKILRASLQRKKK